MKTLKDYIKGYGKVPITLIAEHTSKDGTKYYLCKQDGYNSYYFMKGDEVVKKEYIGGNDQFEKLSLKLINNKRDPEACKIIRKELENCTSYIMFKNFIKSECGEEFKL